MDFFDLTLIAVGLAADAFSVSLGKGMSVRRARGSVMLACGLWFGIFQALMPVGGYFLGSLAADLVDRFDHWIAFILLGIIGGKMVIEGIGESSSVHVGEEHTADDESVKPAEMALLAVATSIDAFAVGVTFAFLEVSVFPAAVWIGILTFLISAAGVRLGSSIGDRLGGTADILGGIILILIGTRLLIHGLRG